MNKIRILGIDPGFDRLGICILDKEVGKETLIHSECITTSKKETFEIRLAEIGDQLSKILKKYKPDELAIETLFFTTNQKTIITVAEVRGVCIYLSHINDLAIYEYSPPQIKLAIAGHGRATKDDIAHMTSKILKDQIKKGILDDEMDAIAIALTHSAHRKMRAFV
ncbi:MAG: crossover junction endodeoxyribonuclease RuvC [Candidatus Nomurabacteria bacterium]|nr:crossover junction endodeoxyribonuclease RuvC [Candidatus Nomurabacteria bacterium]